jgi:hypothetical protein
VIAWLSSIGRKQPNGLEVLYFLIAFGSFYEQQVRFN